MAGIEKYLNTIKNGVFGRDVRKAIHDGLEQTYEDATFDGNTNMEVARARGEFKTLSENLQSINANAESANQKAGQLNNNKVDKNGSGQVTWSMLAQDARTQISGSKTAVVGENSVSTTNIVNGSVTDTKLDERMGFGLIIAGRLLIDSTNSQITLSAGSWFQVGKRNAKIDTTLTSPLPSYETVAQYIIYNDESHQLYTRNLNEIKSIGNRETILAIMYKGALVHPQSSPFVKTIGLKIGERMDHVNAAWATVIQGTIRFDPTTKIISGKKDGDFIISYEDYFINGIDDFEITLENNFGKLLLFNRETKQFSIEDMNSYTQHNMENMHKTSSLLKIAEIYKGEIRHISHESNIFSIATNDKTQSKEWGSLEQLKIDLQTKRTVIVTLGDSTTDGVRTTGQVNNLLDSLTDKPRTFTEIMNNIINAQKGYGFNHKFYNRGFSGRTIAWLKDNLDAVLAPVPEKIDYAFITMGINDGIYNATKIKAFKENHINVINRLIAKGIKPILMSTQAEFENYNRFGSKINSIADNIKKDLAAELGIPFIDYNAGTRDILNNSEYSIKALIPDMCHFGDLGHQKSAEFLVSQLIHRVEKARIGTKIGYQNNFVVSDLNYSDHLTDEQGEVKFLPSKIDGFDLEGRWNGAEKVMFEVLVYVDKPLTISLFGERVRYFANDQSLITGTKLDVGLYKITVKNNDNQAAAFRGLKFN